MKTEFSAHDKLEIERDLELPYTLLAHNYVRPEVQDHSDIVGDSLELALSLEKPLERMIVLG